MSELRDRMIRDMQLRNLSPKTQKGYVYAVAGLAKHYHRSPDQIRADGDSGLPHFPLEYP